MKVEVYKYKEGFFGGKNEVVGTCPSFESFSSLESEFYQSQEKILEDIKAIEKKLVKHYESRFQELSKTAPQVEKFLKETQKEIAAFQKKITAFDSVNIVKELEPLISTQVNRLQVFSQEIDEAFKKYSEKILEEKQLLYKEIKKISIEEKIDYFESKLSEMFQKHTEDTAQQSKALNQFAKINDRSFGSFFHRILWLFFGISPTVNFEHSTEASRTA